jgi:hypothetical protein
MKILTLTAIGAIAIALHSFSNSSKFNELEDRIRELENPTNQESRAVQPSSYANQTPNSKVTTENHMQITLVPTLLSKQWIPGGFVYKTNYLNSAPSEQ